MSETIGFIGLGIMGQGMARNLLKSGFDVTVWNRTTSKMDVLIEAGAKAADHPANLASKCDIIIVCVSDTPDVEAVILGENGVIHGAKRGALVIDMSTISPQVTREISGKLDEKGQLVKSASDPERDGTRSAHVAAARSLKSEEARWHIRLSNI